MENLDTKQLLLLRSIKKGGSSKVKTYHGRPASSPSGLEKYLPRTSTPTMESFTYVDHNDLFDPYEMFRTCLEKPPEKVIVRGMTNPPYHFISGHLMLLKQEKSSFGFRFDDFKKMLKNWFDKYCLDLFRNKCDDAICPPTCKCQKIKSVLNKTISLDEEV